MEPEAMWALESSDGKLKRYPFGGIILFDTLEEAKDGAGRGAAYYGITYDAKPVEITLTRAKGE